MPGSFSKKAVHSAPYWLDTTIGHPPRQLPIAVPTTVQSESEEQTFDETGLKAFTALRTPLESTLQSLASMLINTPAPPAPSASPPPSALGSVVAPQAAAIPPRISADANGPVDDTRLAMLVSKPLRRRLGNSPGAMADTAPFLARWPCERSAMRVQRSSL